MNDTSALICSYDNPLSSMDNNPNSQFQVSEEAKQQIEPSESWRTSSELNLDEYGDVNSTMPKINTVKVFSETFRENTNKELQKCNMASPFHENALESSDNCSLDVNVNNSSFNDISNKDCNNDSTTDEEAQPCNTAAEDEADESQINANISQNNEDFEKDISDIPLKIKKKTKKKKSKKNLTEANGSKKSSKRKNMEKSSASKKKSKRTNVEESVEEADTNDELELNKKNVFERKNIRKILEDENLEEETKAAQKEEMERKQRLLEIQEKLRQQALELRAQREKEMISNMQAKAAANASLKSLLEEKSDFNGSFLDPMKSHGGIINKGSKAPNDVVEISSSSDEDNDDDYQDQDDDDDLIMMSDKEDEDDGTMDPENSGSHVNDLLNKRDENGQVLVNVGHPPNEPDIFLAPQLAGAVKSHQIGGIRFMYENIVDSLERYKTSNGLGCILAHSMGLGKTIQVVAFIDIFLRHTGAKSVLIIVPVNTLQNWINEFNMWLPVVENDTPISNTCVDPNIKQEVDNVGMMEIGQSMSEIDRDILWPREFKLYVINDNMKSVAGRTKVVSEWQASGGVLLMGYEMYRLLIKTRGNPPSKTKKSSTKKNSSSSVTNAGGTTNGSNPEVIDVDEEECNKEIIKNLHEALMKPGPDLVVCDEGHRIKNSHASISQVLKNIRTRRRMVLTGYPLQNNLLEYWCMVDFVRPNYLGSKQEFCNMFERPIMNGQCADSTPQDVKLMRFRAHVLHSLLEGFVQRRGHSVLQAALPQKEEYVIFVRMSAIQRRLYNEFMRTIKETGTVASWNNSNNPIKAFSVCCKIWNHPDILYEVVCQRKEDNDLDLEEAKVVVEGSAPAITHSGKKSRSKGAKNISVPPPPADDLKDIKPFSQMSSPYPMMSTIMGQPSMNMFSSDNTGFGFPQNYPMDFSHMMHGYPQGRSGGSIGSFRNSLDEAVKGGGNIYNSNINNEMTMNQGMNYNDGFGDFMGAFNNQMRNIEDMTINNNMSMNVNMPIKMENNALNYSINNGAHNMGIGNSIINNMTNCYNGISNSNSNSFNAVGNESFVDNNQFNNSIPYKNINNRNFNNCANSSTNLVNNINNNNNGNNNSSPTNNCISKPIISINNTSQANNNPINSTGMVKSEQQNVNIKQEVLNSDSNSEQSKDKVETEGPKGEEKVTLGDKIQEKKEQQIISYDWANDLMKGYITGVLEHSGKILILLDIIEMSVTVGEKLLVFSQSLLTLNLIEDFLSKKRVPNTNEYWAKNRSYFRLDGSTSGIDREKLINQFNDYNSRVQLFLLSTRAGCLGINLIGANRVVIFDASWNPCHDCQAVCRVYRYGQTKCCFVYRLVTDNSMEKNIYDRQINKQGISDRVVDELNPQNMLSKKQVDMLMRFEDVDPPEINLELNEEKYSDPILSQIIKKNMSWLTKEPFTHESLLLDRKDQRLTRQEKRLAKQGYEMEKKMSTLGFSRPSNYPKTLDGMTMRYAQRPIASVRPILSNAARTGGASALTNRIFGNSIGGSGLKPGVSVQQIQTTTDIIIPGTNTVSNSTPNKIPAGEKVLVIKTPKGVYIRTSHGKIFAVRTAPKVSGSDSTTSSVASSTLNATSTATSLSTARKGVMSAPRPIIPSKSDSMSSKGIISKNISTSTSGSTLETDKITPIKPNILPTTTLSTSSLNESTTTTSSQMNAKTSSTLKETSPEKSPKEINTNVSNNDKINESNTNSAVAAELNKTDINDIQFTNSQKAMFTNVNPIKLPSVKSSAKVKPVQSLASTQINKEINSTQSIDSTKQLSYKDGAKALSNQEKMSDTPPTLKSNFGVAAIAPQPSIVKPIAQPKPMQVAEPIRPEAWKTNVTASSVLSIDDYHNNGNFVDGLLSADSSSKSFEKPKLSISHPSPYLAAKHPYASWMGGIGPMWMGAQTGLETPNPFTDSRYHPPNFDQTDFPDLFGGVTYGGAPVSGDSFSSLLMDEEETNRRSSIVPPTYRQTPMPYHPAVLAPYQYHNPYSAYAMPQTGYYPPHGNLTAPRGFNPTSYPHMPLEVTMPMAYMQPPMYDFGPTGISGSNRSGRSDFEPPMTID